METQKQGLQKFTESEVKINNILALKQITYDDLEVLTPAERKRFNQIVTKKINNTTGEKRDEFLIQIELVLSESVKNQLWETNQIVITSHIASLIQQHGYMPTKNTLAEKTGLSRQTIHKHLKEYKSHPQYLMEMEQHRFMASKVLAMVCRLALNGDIKAAKLFLETIGNNTNQPSNNTLINQQNNYIQINGTVLSQESVRQLSPEQLAQIESVIKFALLEVNNI